ncbi:MAG: hypothetical protein QF689_01895, partial [Candidatus Latescibacteria bacterium]|nr:hypothetical protein [Candidatus Latescibacterota bacterium]
MSEIIQSGGEVMWVLVVMSVVALTVLMERLIVLHRAPGEDEIERALNEVEQIVKQSGEKAAAEHCAQGRGFVNYVFLALMKRFDVLVLEERDADDMRDELVMTT